MDAEEVVIYLDGRFVTSGGASIRVDDTGLLYGRSVFETIRAYRGKPFRLERHLERMRSSCRVLGMQMPVDASGIPGAIGRLLSANGLLEAQARVRVTLTGGRATGPPPGIATDSPSLFMTAIPYQPPNQGRYENGITVILSSIRRNAYSPLTAMKSGCYMDSLLARRDAGLQDADDALMLNTEGFVAEMTTSNVFWVRDGTVFTPDVGCGIVPGITREVVLGLCSDHGIPRQSVDEGFEALRESDEMFVTNSMVEILPVREIPGRVFPVCPGPVTTTLGRAYRELVSSETA